MEEILTMGLGIGGAATGLGIFLRALAVAGPKIAEWLRSRARSAEITAEMVAEFMREMRERVDTAEKANTECEARYADALSLIETLRAEIADLWSAMQTGRVRPSVAPGEAPTRMRLEAVRNSGSDDR